MQRFITMIIQSMSSVQPFICYFYASSLILFFLLLSQVNSSREVFLTEVSFEFLIPDMHVFHQSHMIQSPNKLAISSVLFCRFSYSLQHFVVEHLYYILSWEWETKFHTLTKGEAVALIFRFLDWRQANRLWTVQNSMVSCYMLILWISSGRKIVAYICIHEFRSITITRLPIHMWVNVPFPCCLFLDKHHAMKACGGVEVLL